MYKRQATEVTTPTVPIEEEPVVEEVALRTDPAEEEPVYEVEVDPVVESTAEEPVEEPAAPPTSTPRPRRSPSPWGAWLQDWLSRSSSQ